MKITIIGGSKGTGAELATVAMDADHDVTVVSRSGTGPAGATIVTADASALLAKPLADHNEQEAAVFASDLDWTVVRPTGLKDKPATGTWRALEVTDEGTLGGSIPRADLAACILDVLGDDATIGKALGVSS